MSPRWVLPTSPSVLVTGASSGIGEATAYAFARLGARLGLLARREERLESVARRVRELGGSAHLLPVDFADAEAVGPAIERLDEELGGTDVLVNNAGFGIYAALEAVPVADVRRMFEVNAFAPLIACQAVLPGMRRRERGLIVNVSSVVGKRALPMSGAYAASKYALQGLSDALRIELAGTGVRVSVVSPGYTETEFSERVLAYGASRGEPRRGAMSADEVAGAIVDCARRAHREVILTGKGRALAWLERLSPRTADWAISRAIRVRLPELT